MQHVDSDNYSSDYEAIFQDDFIDIDSSSDIEEILNSDSDEENKLLYMTKIGYLEAEASIAMERYHITQRTLPEDAIGPPYFYYENVALAPVGAWTEISLCLYDYGRNKVVPLEPDEVEMLLGFPKNYIRGGGYAKDKFPGDINVLSLFSGISDAEVAFYCLGIPLETNV
ncbi:DNA (Cytosine-5)-methyltransferase DRM1/2 isoform 2 [Hibiscus syriacus]|uniref:DNA (Cytosine-5)-methyltransferase DRM1/2 isoform 2 n=1 Tax=Hibiscus syriacus TaxID=106335 RepID=A0A6A3CJY4_HIBSY|nr:DNA (Cytosine-5)-methyltransferase DRM1/2 isoform 2 [Hibiscus syriacus]